MKIKIILLALSFVNIAYGMSIDSSFYWRLLEDLGIAKAKKYFDPSKYKNFEASDYDIKTKRFGNMPWSLQALALIKVAKDYNGKEEVEQPYLFKDKIIFLRWYLSTLKQTFVDPLNVQLVPRVDVIESVLALTPTLKFNGTMMDLAFISGLKCNIQAMKFFLDRGLSINESWDVIRHKSPLHLVCSSNCDSVTKIEAIQFLIKKGADINNIKDNKTPLMSAFENEDAIEIIEYLLEYGADINRVDENKSLSPLILAVFRRDVNLVSFLVAHGADTSLRDNFNKSALDYAYEVKNAKIIELLENHLKKQEVIDAKSEEQLIEEFLSAAETDNIKGLKRFLDKGMDSNSRGKQQNTALMVAARAGRLEAIEYLLSNGADASLENVFHEKAIDLARASGQTAIIERLSF